MLGSPSSSGCGRDLSPSRIILGLLRLSFSNAAGGAQKACAEGNAHKDKVINYMNPWSLAESSPAAQCFRLLALAFVARCRNNAVDKYGVIHCAFGVTDRHTHRFT